MVLGSWLSITQGLGRRKVLLAATSRSRHTHRNAEGFWALLG